MNKETRGELLIRMEAALDRMELDGAKEEKDEDYIKFKRKYDAIKDGADYTVRSVALEMIAAYACMIPLCNYGFNNKPIKPRGDIRKVVENASAFVKELNGWKQ
ncbi:hypothetical protein J2Z83_000088 [Virgibacillus natechei]|uniref:Uncharacterized protein n=1 Tax=Virgibacillus natechei TaxID=1216297 RepID=A0ABS4IAP3_9BACI|nr:hypothetical protein [Virgibacillus natechei]MBP1967996.1 hypothetical protein [Virgibacillus natechei]UZD14721.1 hypothetical protein OLD84_09560 [Virgibacillus natechei]